MAEMIEQMWPLGRVTAAQSAELVVKGRLTQA